MRKSQLDAASKTLISFATEMASSFVAQIGVFSILIAEVGSGATDTHSFLYTLAVGVTATTAFLVVRRQHSDGTSQLTIRLTGTTLVTSIGDVIAGLL